MPKKKLGAKQLIKKADTLFSLIVRARDGKCQKCGRRPPEVRLQCSHIVSRGYKNTRWDEDNADALCFGCHHWFTNRPLHFEEWVISRIGEDALRELKLRARSTRTKIDYEAVVWRLEERWAELDG